MTRSLVALASATILVALLASVAVAADPNHGAEVSAVAKAVHTTQGNAHGKAVSAIASAHGKDVSAAARARAAANKSANGNSAGQGKGKANGIGHANGKSNAPGQQEPAAEPGRIKADDAIDDQDTGG